MVIKKISYQISEKKYFIYEAQDHVKIPELLVVQCKFFASYSILPKSQYENDAFCYMIIYGYKTLQWVTRRERNKILQ